MLKIKLLKESYQNTVNEVRSTTTTHSTPTLNREQEKLTITPVKFNSNLPFQNGLNAMKLPCTDFYNHVILTYNISNIPKPMHVVFKTDNGSFNATSWEIKKSLKTSP